MVLYLDLFFLVNLLINYLFFEVVSLMMSLSKKRIILGSVFLSIVTIISLWINLPLVVRYSFGLIVVLLVYGYGSVKQFVSLSFLLYIMNLSLGGLTFLINHSVYINLLIGGVVITLAFFIIDKFVFDKKLDFVIDIQVFNKKLSCFIDTGNMALIDGLSICFLKEKYITNEVKFVKKCEITTITGHESINLYKAKVKLSSRLVDCYVAFKDNIPYDAMISPYLLKFKGGKREC